MAVQDRLMTVTDCLGVIRLPAENGVRARVQAVCPSSLQHASRHLSPCVLRVTAGSEAKLAA